MAKKTRGKSRARGPTIKLTLRLSVETATRLGLASAVRRKSQSEIAEGYLARCLKGWRMPSDPEGPALAEPVPGDVAEGVEDAA